MRHDHRLLHGWRSVFYFGYCYNRFWQMHAHAMNAKNSISGCCSLARASKMSVSCARTRRETDTLATHSGGGGTSTSPACAIIT
jgi:hypothetical protein